VVEKAVGSRQASCPVCDTGKVRRVNATFKVFATDVPSEFRATFECPDHDCEISLDQATALWNLK
jgi:hypothetical protein